MANREHVEILKQGAEVWNRWRREHPGIQPDLSFADLSRADLSEANLRGALLNADLRGANLSEALLSWANLSGALLSATVLSNVDLSAVKGLEAVSHLSKSYLDIHTLQNSQGKIPDTFLRGVGASDTFIEYAHALFARPLEFYSCFISYSSKDDAFVKRLYADLQSNNVRCWYAPEDLEIGAKIRPRIDESIRLHEKLLLVLSQHSVNSQWVEQEVETALARERKEQKTILFPVRLDQTVMEIEQGWPALIRNTRNIGDFTRWKDHDSYQSAFKRLLRDLKAEKPEGTL